MEDPHAEPEVNAPAVVAEVTAAFTRYERALVAGELAVLAGSFGADATVSRFGIADSQHGAEELARWRAEQPPLPPGRELAQTTVTTYGTAFAVVTTLFRYPERALLGRQSQVWVKLAGSWRIVHAHVSEIPER